MQVEEGFHYCNNLARLFPVALDFYGLTYLSFVFKL